MIPSSQVQIKNCFNLHSAKIQNVFTRLFTCPFYLSTEGMMMTTQHMETSGTVTRQVTKEVVQRSVMGGTVTKKMFYET